MALYDISAKHAGKPLYAFLGGAKKSMETDLTVGIDKPGIMAQKALDFKNKGVRIIKIKLDFLEILWYRIKQQPGPLWPGGIDNYVIRNRNTGKKKYP